jgi:hypothetical protein
VKPVRFSRPSTQLISAMLPDYVLLSILVRDMHWMVARMLCCFCSSLCLRRYDVRLISRIKKQLAPSHFHPHAIFRCRQGQASKSRAILSLLFAALIASYSVLDMSSRILLFQTKLINVQRKRANKIFSPWCQYGLMSERNNSSLTT